MTIEETLIAISLMENPNSMYITPDGTKLYLIVDENLIYFKGTDLHVMSSDQITRFLQDKLLTP